MIHGIEIILYVDNRWVVLDKNKNVLLSGSGTDQEDAWQKACRAKDI